MSSLLEVSFLNDDPEICGVFVFQTKALLWTSPENTTRLMKFLELSNCLELSGMETDVKQHMLFTLDILSNRLYYKLNYSESYYEKKIFRHASAEEYSLSRIEES